MSEVTDAGTAAEGVAVPGRAGGEVVGPPAWLAYETAFMEEVAEACGTPGGRARMRRVLSSAGMVAGWELPVKVARLVPRGPAGRLAFGAVAGMFAAQTPSVSAGRGGGGGRGARVWQASWGDLGWTVRRAEIAGVLREDSAAERLQRLARQTDLAGLVVECRPLVARVAGEGVPVNWPLLVRDLRRWPERRVDIANDWFFSFAHGGAAGGEVEGAEPAGVAGGSEPSGDKSGSLIEEES
ncbi:type I-E CRISPR-associated protein Cse2/CasB [Kitasatospora sp. NPDC093679]|uniref:type I-E CRISPR-associated protein Cse2/CasB n=1 Tax=Kitasatospora sp. NPDC093679 TaxID=3154983 RepID=UPI003424337F